MSISYSPTPAALRVEIRPSNAFRVLLVGVTLVVLGAIGYAQLTWLLRTVCALCALGYGGYCWRAQSRQSGVLQWHSVWFWHGADGGARALRLRCSTVWPGLIVLIFSDLESRHAVRDKRFVLTLFADSFADDGDSARRLRVYLHHFPVFDSAETEV